MAKNKSTMISKIYGIFKFEDIENDPIYLIIM